MTIGDRTNLALNLPRRHGSRQQSVDRPGASGTGTGAGTVSGTGTAVSGPATVRSSSKSGGSRRQSVERQNSLRSPSKENADETTAPRQRFEILRKLGSGTYGKVSLAYDHKTQQEVAVKIIKKSAIENEQDLIRIRREIRIMSALSHPNIIEIKEVFENNEKIIIVMEYASGGELYDHVSTHGSLREEEARQLFRQITSAVYFCHKHNVAHRDLKLENILMDANKCAKIADFGLSNYFSDKGLLKTFCGSPLYASPEIINGTPYRGPEVDCWSLGVLLYTLVYGSMPFDGRDFNRMIRQIKRGAYYEPDTPTGASMLIRTMLRVNPERRADIEDIANHWWLNADDNCPPIAQLPENQIPVDLTPLIERKETMVVQRMGDESEMFMEYSYMSTATRRKLEEFRRRRREAEKCLERFGSSAKPPKARRLSVESPNAPTAPSIVGGADPPPAPEPHTTTNMTPELAAAVPGSGPRGFAGVVDGRALTTAANNSTKAVNGTASLEERVAKALSRDYCAPKMTNATTPNRSTHTVDTGAVSSSPVTCLSPSAALATASESENLEPPTSPPPSQQQRKLSPDRDSSNLDPLERLKELEAQLQINVDQKRHPRRPQRLKATASPDTENGAAATATASEPLSPTQRRSGSGIQPMETGGGERPASSVRGNSLSPMPLTMTRPDSRSTTGGGDQTASDNRTVFPKRIADEIANGLINELMEEAANGEVSERLKIKIQNSSVFQTHPCVREVYEAVVCGKKPPTAAAAELESAMEVNTDQQSEPEAGVDVSTSFTVKPRKKLSLTGSRTSSLRSSLESPEGTAAATRPTVLTPASADEVSEAVILPSSTSRVAKVVSAEVTETQGTSYQIRTRNDTSVTSEEEEEDFDGDILHTHKPELIAFSSIQSSSEQQQQQHQLQQTPQPRQMIIQQRVNTSMEQNGCTAESEEEEEEEEEQEDDLYVEDEYPSDRLELELYVDYDGSDLDESTVCSISDFEDLDDEDVPSGGSADSTTSIDTYCSAASTPQGVGGGEGADGGAPPGGPPATTIMNADDDDFLRGLTKRQSRGKYERSKFLFGGGQRELCGVDQSPTPSRKKRIGGSQPEPKDASVLFSKAAEYILQYPDQLRPDSPTAAFPAVLFPPEQYKELTTHQPPPPPPSASRRWLKTVDPDVELFSPSPPPSYSIPIRNDNNNSNTNSMFHYDNNLNYTAIMGNSCSSCRTTSFSITLPPSAVMNNQIAITDQSQSTTPECEFYLTIPVTTSDSYYDLPVEPPVEPVPVALTPVPDSPPFFRVLWPPSLTGTGGGTELHTEKQSSHPEASDSNTVLLDHTQSAAVLDSVSEFKLLPPPKGKEPTSFATKLPPKTPPSETTASQNSAAPAAAPPTDANKATDSEASVQPKQPPEKTTANATQAPTAQETDEDGAYPIPVMFYAAPDKTISKTVTDSFAATVTDTNANGFLESNTEHESKALATKTESGTKTGMVLPICTITKPTEPKTPASTMVVESGSSKSSASAITAEPKVDIWKPQSSHANSSTTTASSVISTNSTASPSATSRYTGSKLAELTTTTTSTTPTSSSNRYSSYASRYRYNEPYRSYLGAKTSELHHGDTTTEAVKERTRSPEHHHNGIASPSAYDNVSLRPSYRSRFNYDHKPTTTTTPDHHLDVNSSSSNSSSKHRSVSAHELSPDHAHLLNSIRNSRIGAHHDGTSTGSSNTTSRDEYVPSKAPARSVYDMIDDALLSRGSRDAREPAVNRRHTQAIFPGYLSGAYGTGSTYGTSVSSAAENRYQPSSYRSPYTSRYQSSNLASSVASASSTSSTGSTGYRSRLDEAVSTYHRRPPLYDVEKEQQQSLVGVAVNADSSVVASTLEPTSTRSSRFGFRAIPSRNTGVVDSMLKKQRSKSVDRDAALSGSDLASLVADAGRSPLSPQPPADRFDNVVRRPYIAYHDTGASREGSQPKDPPTVAALGPLKSILKKQQQISFDEPEPPSSSRPSSNTVASTKSPPPEQQEPLSRIPTVYSSAATSGTAGVSGIPQYTKSSVTSVGSPTRHSSFMQMIRRHLSSDKLDQQKFSLSREQSLDEPTPPVSSKLSSPISASMFASKDQLLLKQPSVSVTANSSGSSGYGTSNEKENASPLSASAVSELDKPRKKRTLLRFTKRSSTGDFSRSLDHEPLSPPPVTGSDGSAEDTADTRRASNKPSSPLGNFKGFFRSRSKDLELPPPRTDPIPPPATTFGSTTSALSTTTITTAPTTSSAAYTAAPYRKPYNTNYRAHSNYTPISRYWYDDSGAY